TYLPKPPSKKLDLFSFFDKATTPFQVYFIVCPIMYAHTFMLGLYHSTVSVIMLLLRYFLKNFSEYRYKIRKKITFRIYIKLIILYLFMLFFIHFLYYII